MSDNVKYITLTEENFATEVLQSNSPVVVDFWAPWCGPCRVMNPIVAKLAEDFEGVVKVGKLNIDDYEQLASKYHVMAIPAIYFFSQGEVIEQLSGLIASENLTDKVNNLIEQHAAKIA
jgi:thioredoxin 1